MIIIIIINNDSSFSSTGSLFIPIYQSVGSLSLGSSITKSRGELNPTTARAKLM